MWKSPRVRLKPLDRQVMVIVGASSGIGLATARLAASRGARLVVAGRSEHALGQLVAEIRHGGGEAVAVIADIAHEAEVQRIGAEACRAFGGFDTWVNNAAVSAYGECLETSSDDIRRIVDVNLLGFVYGSRVACAELRTHGGALINLGSVLSDRAAPLQGIYSASKHAIKGWTDALRTELLHHHTPISVTLIKPAAIGTAYNEHASSYFTDQPMHTPPVYSPRCVARAILHAATHPVREIVVGSAGHVLVIAGRVAPAITDMAMARLLMPAMHSGYPRHGRPALYSPTEDLRERGDYPGLVRPSFSTELAIRPRLKGALLGALAVTLAAAAAVASNGSARRTSTDEPIASNGEGLRYLAPEDAA